MKGLVVAFFLFMNALSSAIGEILLPVTADPWLVWIWGAPTVALALQTIVFWFRFRHLNNEAWTEEEEPTTVVQREEKV
jgi:cytochrome c-type biogenesis protein CcmH/NrfF